MRGRLHRCCRGAGRAGVCLSWEAQASAPERPRHRTNKQSKQIEKTDDSDCHTEPRLLITHAPHHQRVAFPRLECLAQVPSLRLTLHEQYPRFCCRQQPAASSAPNSGWCHHLSETSAGPRVAFAGCLPLASLQCRHHCRCWPTGPTQQAPARRARLNTVLPLLQRRHGSLQPASRLLATVGLLARRLTCTCATAAADGAGHRR